ncbi:hypothetical protein DFH08DRAFT_977302 [Mycena albidolilacea]|uniref:Uncharacterized protein n=1 Tax=Mycena albidolilacea TaxID=1033008 RepID=A0AAD6Z1I7_9AGAR|nr:hypothetical protein DFH08DRAFT_977302 [Mycena albidolilacea]
MKSFATILSATALGVSAVGAAALSGSFDPPLSASASASDIAASGSLSSVPPISTVPTPTGGFVITGVYTTCLTLTFPGPMASTRFAAGFAGPLSTWLTADINLKGDCRRSLKASDSGPLTSDSATLSGTGAASSPSVVTSLTGSPGTDLPLPSPIPDQAIFTTCLAFLATPTDTATSTQTFTDSGSATTAPTASNNSALPSESATITA